MFDRVRPALIDPGAGFVELATHRRVDQFGSLSRLHRQSTRLILMADPVE